MQTEDEKRHLMVKFQLESRGITDKALLAALEKVRRHLFVSEVYRTFAYEDMALSAACGQTISQPYIVARMTELLHLTRNHRVLEIGTGTGYQTAILAELAGEVYTMEIIPELHESTKSNPEVNGYANITFIAGNGYLGYPPAAPFDAIIVTAAPHFIPEELVRHLAAGGRMVIPGGEERQELKLIIKNEKGESDIFPILGVRFVRMTGKP